MLCPIHFLLLLLSVLVLAADAWTPACSGSALQRSLSGRLMAAEQEENEDVEGVESKHSGYNVLGTEVR